MMSDEVKELYKQKMANISEDEYKKYCSGFKTQLEDLDSELVSRDIKKYLDDNKMNMVDNKRATIQVYPNPEDPKYPNLTKFAKICSDIFDFGDVTFDQFLSPDELFDCFEAKMRECQKNVNEDKEFWENIRTDVMPLYAPPEEFKDSEKWASRFATFKIFSENRWQKMELKYDPEPLGVKVTHKTSMAKNIKTGEIRDCVEVDKVISDHIMPPGFMIDII